MRSLAQWKTGLLGVAVVVALGVAGQGQQAVPERYSGDAGPYQVAELMLDWHDDARDRDVPAKAYYPEGDIPPCPLIIFSHGLGGTREGYEYLGRHWASHGYISTSIALPISLALSGPKSSSTSFRAKSMATAGPWLVTQLPSTTTRSSDERVGSSSLSIDG